MSFRVIGIGEVLWDLLPSGPQLGGAPANFACHSRQLGANASVVTRVGDDINGKWTLQQFREMNIFSDAVQVDESLPTGTADVVLDGSGSPQFVISDGVAWDALTCSDEAFNAVRDAHAICFGTLAQRTGAAACVIQQLVAATPFTSLRVFDVNLRQRFYCREILERSLTIANILKLNEHELAVLSPIFELFGPIRERLLQLAERFDLRVVALTRAEGGSLLYHAGNWSELPGCRTEIVDTVGAGDAFTAALVMGLLHQFSLDDIHRVAQEIAGFVCSQPGATPVLPSELRLGFSPNCTIVK